MNNAIKTALATGMGILIASTALAADADYSFDPTTPGGFYGSVFGGLAIPNDAEGEQDPSVDPDYVNGVLDLENGLSLTGELGYDFGNGLRVEAQLGYLNMGTGLLSFPDAAANAPFDVAETDGTASIIYGMANAWYDVDLGAFSPFAGGGIGYASANIDMTFDLGGNNGIDDRGGAFAWQIGGGAAVDLSEQVSVVGRYRYFATSDFSLTDNEGTDQSWSISTHIIDLGLKFNF